MPSTALLRFRIWHLWLLAAFVAFAIVNVQDQRRREPFLIGLAIGGFVVYALIGWAAWRVARRFRDRLAKLRGNEMRKG